MGPNDRTHDNYTWALLCLALSAGCAEPEPPREQAAELVRDELSAELGPEGGVLEGAPGSELSGVRLELPPGALREPVTLRVRRAGALPILPDGAEGVGPAFELEPAGLALGANARLTVPVNADTRATFDEPAEACRVWVHVDGAWRRHDNVAASEHSVTVELAQLAPALAGVVLTPRPVSGTRIAACDGLSDTRCMPLDCGTVGAYCVEPQPSLKPKSPLAVFGSKLYFQELQSVGGRFARFDLDGHTLSRFQHPGCQLGDLSGDVSNELVGDGLGNAWRRTCRIDFAARTTQPVQLAPIPSGPSKGLAQFAVRAVTRSDGQVVMLAKGLATSGTSGTFLNRMSASGGTAATVELAPFEGHPVEPVGQLVADPDVAGQFWLLGLSSAPPNGLGLPFQGLGALMQLDERGRLLRVIEDDARRRLVDLGSDGQFVQLIPNRLLAVRDGHVHVDTVVEEASGAPRQERLYAVGPSDQSLPEGVPLPTLAERAGFADAIANRIQAAGLAAVDDEGGTWAAITTRIGGVSVNLSRLVHFPPEGGKPFVLDSDVRIQQVLAAPGGRIVVRAIPAGKTEAEVFVIRRNRAD